MLTGAGKNFVPIDLSLLANVQAVVDHADPARSHERLRLILDMQDCLTSVRALPQPVIAAIHGAHRRRADLEDVR